MAVAYLFAILMAMAQAVAIAAAIVAVASLAARTRRSAVLWLLAVITRRHLPLALELESLGEGLFASDRWRLNAAANRVRAGASLAEALSSTPGLVSEDVIVLAHVGERSQRLGEALSAEAARLARIREGAVTSTTSPSLALIYLVGVPLVVPVILTGLMIFIIPKYKKILSDFDVPLPWVTEELVLSSEFVGRFWFVAFGGFMVTVTVVGILLVLGRVYGWDLHLPNWAYPGARSRRQSLALRAFAVAASAGRPLSDALDVLANVPRSGLDRWQFSRLRTRYQAGENLWNVLAAERFLSHRDTKLLAAAEQAGNLPWALDMLAERIDDRQQRRLTVILEIVQPAFVVALGALVLFICLGMFLPMVQIVNEFN